MLGNGDASASRIAHQLMKQHCQWLGLSESGGFTKPGDDVLMEKPGILL